MKVTWKKVRNLSPCSEALAWGQDHFADRQEINASTLLMALLKDKHFQPPSAVLCKECLEALDKKFQNLASGFPSPGPRG